MSVTVMSYVWKNCKEKGSKKLMLLAIADNANDEGFAWPSVNTLAEKTCMSERNARKIIDALEADGLLRVFNRFDGNGDHGDYSNLYQVFMGEIKDIPQDIRGTTIERLTSMGRGECQPRQSGSVSHDSRGVSATTSESSLEPSLEPPERKKNPLLSPKRKSDKVVTEVDDLEIAIAEFKKLEPERASVRKLAALLRGEKNGQKHLDEMEYPATGNEFRAFVLWMELRHNYTDLKTFAADRTWLAWFNRFRDARVEHKNALLEIENRQKKYEEQGKERLASEGQSGILKESSEANDLNVEDWLDALVERAENVFQSKPANPMEQRIKP